MEEEEEEEEKANWNGIVPVSSQGKRLDGGGAQRALNGIGIFLERVCHVREIGGGVGTWDPKRLIG